MLKKKLIFIELNEINFDLVKKYKKKNLKSFNIISKNIIETKSEKEHKYLEPWIQWVSIHTGLSAKQHKIFRLGEIINYKNLEQIFELVESNQYKVGCISPMNTENKLINPAFFIPDPWTETLSDSSFWSKLITKVTKYAVNNNTTQKVGIINYLSLGLIFF